MAKKSGDRISAPIKDVETAARSVRANLRRRAKAETRTLQRAADRLRKVAADVAGQVEKYIHELRMELEGPPKQPAKKAQAKKTRARKTRARKTRPRTSAAARGTKA